MDIKLPGVNTAHIKFEFPEWIKKNFVIHITGKWFQYGVLFIVLLLDLNMWKNQIFYEPFAYGQYAGEDGHIFSISDAFTLANYTNKTIYSYDWRNNTIDPTTNKTYITGDYKTNSRYRGYSLAVKGTAFIPSILTFLIFALLIHFFGKLSGVSVGKAEIEHEDVSLTDITAVPSVRIEHSFEQAYVPMSDSEELSVSEDAKASEDPQV